jgi:hypothetical protein
MDIAKLQLRICYLDLFLPFAILLEVKAATLTLIKTDSPAYMINSDNIILEGRHANS